MRSFSPSRLAQFLRLVVGIFMMLHAGDSWGMSVVAGMCDPSGASAPAPLPVREARGGSIDILEDCDRFLFLLEGDQSPEDAASIAAPDDGPKSALSAAFQLPRLPGERCLSWGPRGLPERSAHGLGVFRPPRG